MDDFCVFCDFLRRRNSGQVSRKEAQNSQKGPRIGQELMSELTLFLRLLRLFAANQFRPHDALHPKSGCVVSNTDPEWLAAKRRKIRKREQANQASICRSGTPYFLRLLNLFSAKNLRPTSGWSDQPLRLLRVFAANKSGSELLAAKRRKNRKTNHEQGLNSDALREAN